MLVKLANALTRHWHDLGPEAKILAGKAGMIRSKRTYAMGLIKGNKNIQQRIEQRFGKPINFKHGRNWSSVTEDNLVTVDHNANLGQFKRKDKVIDDALSKRHELREQHYGHLYENDAVSQQRKQRIKHYKKLQDKLIGKPNSTNKDFEETYKRLLYDKDPASWKKFNNFNKVNSRISSKMRDLEHNQRGAFFDSEKAKREGFDKVRMDSVFGRNKGHEIRGNHNSAALVLHDIVDAKKIPHESGRDILGVRGQTGEGYSVMHFLKKGWTDFKHSDARKIVRRELRDPNGWVAIPRSSK